MGRKKSNINPLCGARIKQLCKSKGITQAELADEVGYSPHTISKIACGKLGVSPYIAKRINDKYPDVSMQWLMGDPDAFMTEKEGWLADREKFADKLSALQNLLEFSDFRIDSTPIKVKGFSEPFCTIERKSNHDFTWVGEHQLQIIVNIALEVLQNYLFSVMRIIVPPEALLNDFASYADVYLNDAYSHKLHSLGNDKNEKKILKDFVAQVHADLSCDTDITDDILKKRSKSFNENEDEEK